MNKTCSICGGNGVYKCPICLIFYCSVKCCKKHREDKCEVIQREEKPIEKSNEKPEKSKEEISAERLELLKNSDEVKQLLTNKHLQDLLITIDQAENAEEIMQKAMLEPIFVEFADACLKAVEPQTLD